MSQAPGQSCRVLGAAVAANSWGWQVDDNDHKASLAALSLPGWETGQ